MTAVITRIILRYLSGALVAYGLVTQEVAAELVLDPDLALAIGAAIGAATEGIYSVAKSRGWTT
ncbi:MAG: hypothetical protein ACK4NW_01920 [Roseinatronobacter sp.]